MFDEFVHLFGQAVDFVDGDVVHVEGAAQLFEDGLQPFFQLRDDLCEAFQPLFVLRGGDVYGRFDGLHAFGEGADGTEVFLLHLHFFGRVGGDGGGQAADRFQAVLLRGALPRRQPTGYRAGCAVPSAFSSAGAP